jgi:hypothetical protein
MDSVRFKGDNYDRPTFGCYPRPHLTAVPPSSGWGTLGHPTMMPRRRLTQHMLRENFWSSATRWALVFVSYLEAP